MLTLDVINFSKNRDTIGFSPDMHKLAIAIGSFNIRNIYNHPILLDYGKHIDKIIAEVFEYFFCLFKQYGYEYEAYKKSNVAEIVGFGKYLQGMKKIYEDKKEKPLIILTDYISGMTDTFVLNCMKNISLPAPIKFRI